MNLNLEGRSRCISFVSIGYETMTVIRARACATPRKCLLKYTFSVTSNLRQSSTTRRTFKTSNGPTSASSKVETTLGACYAIKPCQICQSDGLDKIIHSRCDFKSHLLLFSIANLRIHLLRLFSLSLNKDSLRINNMMRKKEMFASRVRP